MQVSAEQKRQALDAASEKQLFLYGDPQSGEALEKIASRHTGTITNYNAFAIAIGDVVLGLVPQEKLPDLLIERLQITRPDAMKVTADVLDFLSPLSTGGAIASNGNENLAAEIAEAEAALQSVVQPMRTMAHDMETARQPQAAPAHQAVPQDQLLAGNQTQNPNASWNTTQS